MEAWYAKNRHRFALGRQDQLAVLFEVAATAETADELARCLKEWAGEYEGVVAGIERGAPGCPDRRPEQLHSPYPSTPFAPPR